MKKHYVKRLVVVLLAFLMVVSCDQCLPGVPEMHVYWEASEISAAALIEFGNVSADCSKQISFQIENDGDVALQLKGGSPWIKISGTDKDAFSVVTEPPASLSPGGSAEFSIQFHPTTAGTKFAMLSITTNESDKAFTFAVSGEAVYLGSPVVSGSSLTDDATPTWSWTIPEGSVDIRYRLNDDSWTEIGGTEISSYTPLEPLADGTYTLAVQAKDLGGSWSESGSFAITIDTTVPLSPVVTAPTLTNDDTPTWTWSVPSGAIDFRFKLDDGDWVEIGGIAITSFTPTQPLSDGSHSFCVQAKNEAGNWSDVGSASILVDTIPPLAPEVSGRAFTSDTTPTWTWSVPSGTANFRYQLDGGTWSETGGIVTQYFPSTALSDGSYLLNVQAADAAGNWSSSGSCTVVVDTVPPQAPVVTGTTPTDDATPTWSWTLPADAVEAGYQLDSGTIVLCEDLSMTSFTPTSDLSTGKHTLRVWAVDAAENCSEPGSRAITIASKLITCSPTSLNFKSYQSGANPASQSLGISNGGGGELSWSASENASWLSLSGVSGVSGGEVDSISVSVDATGLAVGSYSTLITISGTDATNTPQKIPVSLLVSPPPTGKFKVVNSWGVGGWENVADGFYWFTFEAMKKTGVYAYFLDDQIAYLPQYVAVFSIEHPVRGDVSVLLGVGDPQSPKATKRFYPSFYTDAGGNEFLSDPIALDISEFSRYLNSYDLFIRVLDSSANEMTGTLQAFSVERYDAEGVVAATMASYTELPLATVNGGSIYAFIHTAQSIGEPVSRLARSSKVAQLFETRPLLDSEVENLKQRVGVREKGRNYNTMIGNHGTGLAPPTDEEWDEMSKSGRTLILRKDSSVLKQTRSVDLTKDEAFPPVGNQGSQGSCVAFSTAYYSKTFKEAKEHGLSFAGTTWTGTWPGYPSDHLEYVMSPRFVYNLVNWGMDNGSSYLGNFRILADIGCAPWSIMAYNDDECVSWPSETVWRAAPRNRGAWPDSAKWGTSYSLYVDSDEDIEILKTLLENDIPVSISIDAGQYANLSSEDVWDTTNYLPDGTNHANTLVGYEE